MNRFEKVSLAQYKKDILSVFERLGRSVNGLNIEQDYDELQLPTRSTKYSAGYDFRSPIDLIAYPNHEYLIPTGIKCEIDKNKVLLCYPRSSYGFKFGFNLSNTVGVIDSDYYNNLKNEGHIMVGFTVKKELHIKKGDKLFQAVFTRFYTVDYEETNLEERNGGIGSTGA